jgi:hypothetical protein
VSIPDLDTAEARTAYERAWYLARLEDPEVLGRAVVLPSGLLAVPCGGPRAAGSVLAASQEEARQIVSLLRGRPVFPLLRIDLVSPGEIMVRWGAQLPRRSARAAGQFYGYADDAIRDFLAGNPGIRRDSWQQP